VAATFALEPERLLFGNGSDELFSLLNQTYLQPGDVMVCGQYGFLAYRISALANQAEVRLAPEPEMRLEIDALLALVDERTRIVFVSNPANPTGSWNTAEEIRRLHAALPANVLLVIDEAYAEYVVEPGWESALDLAREAENLVVTRTFSKIHGLAALRVGFAYAPRAVAEAVDRIRLPFNNSIPAQAAAIAALADTEHQARSRAYVAQWLPRLIQAIRGVGFEVFPSAGNFVLVRFPDPARSAARADAFLQSRGVIVRAVGGYGLPDCLRITVGTPEQNEVLIDALREFARG
jgi:histidinol-phosphate aminotransferase